MKEKEDHAAAPIRSIEDGDGSHQHTKRLFNNFKCGTLDGKLTSVVTVIFVSSLHNQLRFEGIARTVPPDVNSIRESVLLPGIRLKQQRWEDDGDALHPNQIYLTRDLIQLDWVN